MDFTFRAYSDLIASLKENGYTMSSYADHSKYDKCVILRHDIDLCLETALAFAQYEQSLKAKSTYFILLSSDSYNIASRRNLDIIHDIRRLGHGIGLHFDEVKYQDPSPSHINKDVPELIENEINIMSEILEFQITTVSMHRPSKETLASDYQIPSVINSYSKTFFEEFKYLSDSRRFWREPILDLVDSHQHPKLHILTHPFWYSENNLSASETCEQFVNSANHSRYMHMRENIRDFDEFMGEEEVK
ncbi:MAG: hypothetical protein FWG40_00100 [Peptococcaceae bacterium]|nr:hypothetical protein [Peptococcaceae bacterium]